MLIYLFSAKTARVNYSIFFNIQLLNIDIYIVKKYYSNITS